MHRCSSSEVETSQLEGPAAGIPGPTGDGVVDYGSPDEHEDHAWQHAAAFRSSTNRECDAAEVNRVRHRSPTTSAADLRDRREHALVDGKQQVRDLRTADRRRTKNIPEADVVEVSHETPRRL